MSCELQGHCLNCELSVTSNSETASYGLFQFKLGLKSYELNFETASYWKNLRVKRWKYKSLIKQLLFAYK